MGPIFAPGNAKPLNRHRARRQSVSKDAEETSTIVDRSAENIGCGKIFSVSGLLQTHSRSWGGCCHTYIPLCLFSSSPLKIPPRTAATGVSNYGQREAHSCLLFASDRLGPDSRRPWVACASRVKYWLRQQEFPLPRVLRFPQKAEGYKGVNMTALENRICKTLFPERVSERWI